MAADREVAHTVLGILGDIASCLFFVSSAPTVVKIVRSKSSGGLSGDLFVFTLFNCLMWCLYGLPFVHPHDQWVVITNSFGSTFSLIFIFTYLLYATPKEKTCLLWKLSGVVSSFAILVVLLFILSHSQHQRILVVGTISTIVSSAMHITLLLQCRQAIQLKEREYLQPSASIGAFIKGFIWLAYGLVNFDIFILIPNGVGVLVGFIQLMVMLFIVKSLGSSPSSFDTEKSSPEANENNKEPNQEKLDSAKNNPSIFSNVSRVPSIIGITRQGSISSNVIVPITLDDDFVQLDIH